MGRQRVGFSLRPDRIAFLVNVNDPFWVGTCARIMQYCSLVWGGAGNVVVPTDGKQIDPEFWELLERFEPDYVTYYKRTGADIKLDEPDKFATVLAGWIEQWEVQIGESSTPHQIEHIEEDLLRTFTDDFSLSASLQDELRDRLAPFYFGEHVAHHISGNSEPQYPHTQIKHVLKAAKEQIEHVKVYETSQPELSLWIASALGHISPKYFSWFTDAGVEIERESVVDLSKVAADLVHRAKGMTPSRNPTLATPLDVASIALGNYHPLSNHDYSLTTLVVAGEGVKDFCYYMCLSRMRVRVVWMPPWLLRGVRNIVHASSGLPDAFYFTSAVRSAAGYSSQYNNTIELVSFTLTVQERSHLLKRLQENGLLPLEWLVREGQRFSLQPVRLYERNNAGIPELYEVNSDGLIELYTGRPPKHLRDFSPQDIRWIAEITFGDVQIPSHSALGTWIAGRSTQEARTTKNAVSYLNVNMMVLGSDDPEAASYRPHLRVPTTLGIFRQISSCIGITASPSDKGIYTRVTLDKFGGLDAAARFFRSSLGISLTAAYQADRNSPIGIYLPDEQRRFLDWKTIREFCDDDVAPTKLIDEFSQKSIFYRGFIFQCEICRRSSWYSISDLTDAFTCKRCHRTQIFSSSHWKKPHQPLWYHQLDEVVFQAIRNDCHIPILALSALAARLEGKLSFCEELDFVAEAARAECDLNCVVDGHLAVGEVKKDGRLASSHKKEVEIVGKYLLLASKLNATRVVFATLATKWRPETRDLITKQFADRRPKVIFLDRSDLLP